MSTDAKIGGYERNEVCGNSYHTDFVLMEGGGVCEDQNDVLWTTRNYERYLIKL